MSATTETALRRAHAGTALVFFVHGASIATWVPRIPAIKERLGLTEGSLGIALLGIAAGALVTMQLVGPLLARYGSRPVTRVAAFANASLLLAPALAWNLPSLLVGLGLFGVSIGLLDPAMNAHGVVVEQRRGRPIMAGLHSMWSIGGLVGSAAAGLAARAGWDPLLHFTVAAVVLGTVAAVATRELLPAEVDAVPVPAEGGDQALGAGGAASRWGRAVLLLGLIGFCSFLAEGTAADWSALYLRELGASPGAAAAGFAAFSLCMAAGRLVGDRLTSRFGPVRLVRDGSLVAAGGLGLGVVAGNELVAVAGFGLLGAGLAAVVPIAFSAAGNLGGPGGVGIARVASLAYLGTLAGPPAVGFTAQATSLRFALLIPVALCVLIATCAAGVIPAGGSRGAAVR
ncbi:MAG TPA: MFS transporter [Actinomycetota bacterium]|nr:MFS transporter [Actinomycetota bacterium]